MSDKISMEEFADESGRNISLRDFYGQRVIAVSTSDEGEWTMHLSGGGKIHNYDPLVPAPTVVIGQALTQIILGGKQVKGQHVTELRFGLEPIYLNPLEYAMQDKVITNDKIVFAQRSRANA